MEDQVGCRLLSQWHDTDVDVQATTDAGRKASKVRVQSIAILNLFP